MGHQSPLKNKNIRLYFYIYIFLAVCQDLAVVYYMIGNWQWFWWPLDTSQSSADGLACCTTTPQQSCWWGVSARGPLQSNSWSNRIAPCPHFSMSSLWSPCFECLNRGRLVSPVRFPTRHRSLDEDVCIRR